MTSATLTDKRTRDATDWRRDACSVVGLNDAAGGGGRGQIAGELAAVAGADVQRRVAARRSAGAVDRGLQLAPNTPELMRLGDALEEGTGRLDVTPFLPRAAQPAETPPETDPDEDRRRMLDF